MFAEQWASKHRCHLPTVICHNLCARAPTLGENWEGRRRQPRLDQMTLPGIGRLSASIMAAPDYSIGFTQQEVEEILAAQKEELKRTLAAWSESGSTVTKRRIDEIHAVIEACQKALRRLAPQIYGRPVRVGTSEIIGHLPK